MAKMIAWGTYESGKSVSKETEVDVNTYNQYLEGNCDEFNWMPEKLYVKFCNEEFEEWGLCFPDEEIG